MSSSNPRLQQGLSERTRRVVASFEQGRMMGMTTMAMTRVRWGDGCEAMTCSKSDLAQRPEHGHHMAVRQAAEDLEAMALGRRIAAEGSANDIDDVRRQVRQVADGLVFDPAALTIGASQEVSLVDPAFTLAPCGGWLTRPDGYPPGQKPRIGYSQHAAADERTSVARSPW
jgi:hypothetical protein